MSTGDAAARAATASGFSAANRLTIIQRTCRADDPVLESNDEVQNMQVDDPTDDAIGDPLAWPPHAQAWLQASPLRKKLEHKNEMLAETVTVLRRELGAQWLNYTLDDHRWGFTNVQRRNYMVQFKDAEMGWTDLLCLPPLADL